MRRFLLGNTRLLIALAIVIALTFMSPVFLTKDNLLNVLRQMALLVILSIGMTMAIITGGIDLSIGSVLALSSCLAASFLKRGDSMWPGVMVAFAIGGAAGLLNGIMIAKVKLPPFIATYGMGWITRGIAYVYMGGNIIYGFRPQFRFLGAGYLMGIPMPIIVMACVFTAFYIFLHRTVYGRNIYAVGCNEAATRLSGVRTDRVIIMVYTLNGLLVALAGLLYIARLNAAEPVIGESFPLEAIAATLVGGTPFTGGEGGITGTLFGAFILTLLSNGMNLLGVSSLWQSAVLGSVIVLAILAEEVSKLLTGAGPRLKRISPSP
ncbi:MAG TPA: ABC transporter permease [Firmicutes bacterium]|nr:ABC transporter permease [Bacillota bacterium]